MDLVKIFAVFQLVLGFGLTKSRKRRVFAAVPAIVGLAVILMMGDIDNRIFITLGMQILVQVILFEGRLLVKCELATLLHFGFSTIDGLAHSMLLLIFNGTTAYSDPAIHGFAAIVGIFILIVLIFILAPYKQAINENLQNFTLKIFFYYLACLFLSGVVIGYAGIMAMEVSTAFRLRAAMFIGANGMGILIIIFAILIHVFIIQKRNLALINAFSCRCMDEQARQYEVIGTKNEELKRFCHDYNAHLHVLKRIAEKGDLDALVDYLGDLDDLQKSFDLVFTNNIIGDAIINEYYEKCQGEGIEFKVVGRFPDQLAVANTDLCVILSNGVKNAYEAAQACGDEKFISIEIENYKTRTFITIRNTVDCERKLKNGLMATSKSDGENHGFGMGSMLDIAKKYGGRVTWQYDGGTGFITKIRI